MDVKGRRAGGAGRIGRAGRGWQGELGWAGWAGEQGGVGRASRAGLAGRGWVGWVGLAGRAGRGWAGRAGRLAGRAREDGACDSAFSWSVGGNLVDCTFQFVACLVSPETCTAPSCLRPVGICTHQRTPPPVVSFGKEAEIQTL